MSQEQWTAVDDYINDKIVPSDAALDAALESSAQAGLPSIQVAPNQGKFISILARSVGAKSILEIGTLGGYSTIWLARALPPSGRMISLELDPRHAEVARANLARAGFANTVEVRVGRALDSLPQLASNGHAPFDFVFIDADKPSNTEYYQWALNLTHPGSMIVVDNVVRNGGIADANNTDAAVVGTRRFFDYLATETRVTASAIQSVGSKGYDGLCISVVL